MNRITTYIRQSLQEIYPPEEVKALSMLICCDMLGLDALDIYMGKDIILSECKQRELENIIFRLQKNEPIQYIRGFAEFDGRRFKVAPGVLIPRPETVELVELVARENTDACRLLDIGTGSGCIAISLDKRLPDAKVEAWDISEEALAIAYTNNKELKAEVMFLQRDVLSDDWEKTPSFDVIVSNPPYVTEAEKTEWMPMCLTGNRNSLCLSPMTIRYGSTGGLQIWVVNYFCRRAGFILKSTRPMVGKQHTCLK